VTDLEFKPGGGERERERERERNPSGKSPIMSTQSIVKNKLLDIFIHLASVVFLLYI
jgi:hypothetical protein